LCTITANSAKSLGIGATTGGRHPIRHTEPLCGLLPGVLAALVERLFAFAIDHVLTVCARRAYVAGHCPVRGLHHLDPYSLDDVDLIPCLGKDAVGVVSGPRHRHVHPKGVGRVQATINSVLLLQSWAVRSGPVGRPGGAAVAFQATGLFVRGVRMKNASRPQHRVCSARS
jgi:hypothetical protein